MIDNILKLFSEKGEKKVLTVITPFLITDPNKVFFIESGSINLSSTYTKNLKPTGKLYNFFTVKKLQLFYGFPFSRTDGLVFFADAEEDSVVWELPISILKNELIKNKPLSKEFEALIGKWIKNLYYAVSNDTTVNKPNSIDYITEKGEYEFEEGVSLSTTQNVLLIDTKRINSLLFNGHIDINYSKNIIFPISNNSFFKARKKIKLSIISLVDFEWNEDFWNGLDMLHKLILLSDDFEANQYKILDENRIQRKYELIDEEYSKVIYNTKTLLNKENSFDGFKGKDESSDNNLWHVCKLVADKHEIKLKLPPKLDESLDPISDITRYSGIRYREILFESDWYKNESGASMVGFYANSNKPIALISEKNGKFVAYDFEQHISFKIDAKNAHRIERIAYALYKPLPDKKLNLNDLFTYAFANGKNDLKKLVFAATFASILSLVMPILSAVIFDEIIPNAQRSQLWHITFALFVAAIGGIFFEISKSISIIRLRGVIDSNLQAAVWDRLLSLPTDFFRRFTSGDLAERSLAITHMVNILSGVTVNSILSGAFTIFNFLLLFYINAQLALIALLLALILIFMMAYLGNKQIKIQNIILTQEGENSGFVLQLLTGIATLKTSGSEAKAFLQWFKKFTYAKKYNIELERIQNIQKIFTSSFYLLALMFIYYAMIKLAGNLTTGRFLAFNAAYGTVVFALMELSSSIVSALQVIPIYNRLKPIIEEIPEDSGAKDAPPILKGNVEISNINFRYAENGPLILKNVSLNIKTGDYIALVGPSGSGKSTIIRLLLGFNKPESGTILYEGQNLNNIDAKLLRKQIGVVLQDGSLMGGDIYTNIVGSSPSLTLNDAWAAAEAAAFDKEIEEMPMGMFTVINDEGGTLSGGQKQRLMIARALVHQPKILIFDEATSALDNRTQAVVTDSLNKLQVTRMVVAHRLSTIMKAKRIIYLEGGEIIEEGSYEELMNIKGKFFKLAERQLE